MILVQESVSKVKTGSSTVAKEIHNNGIQPLGSLLASFKILLVGYHVGNLVLKLPVDSFIVFELKGPRLACRFIFCNQEAWSSSHSGFLDLCQWKSDVTLLLFVI